MKKTISLILVFFMIAGLCACKGDAGDEGTKKSPVSVTGAITYEDEDLKLDSLAESYLKGFFDDVYRFMATWEDTDFTKYFSDEAQGLICQSAMELYRDIRKGRHVDLKMEYVDYEILIADVEEKAYGYRLSMFEDYDCTFTFMDKESNTKNVYSWIGLEQNGGVYSLRFYDREEDFYYLILSRYDEESDTDAKTQIENIVSEMKETFRIQNEAYSAMLNDIASDKVVLSCDKMYDRESAVNYALKYAFGRNTDNFLSFDDLGGNCQNYASQVLIRGGIDMDIKGPHIWKYYDSAHDETENPEGRTSSWTEVNAFYEYAKNNKDGFLCKVDGNIYTALPGDVLQMSSRTSSYAHSVVATGMVFDAQGNIIDILTSSNTVDRYNFPLCAYNYPYFRLIQIYGYNN